MGVNMAGYKGIWGNCEPVWTAVNGLIRDDLARLLVGGRPALERVTSFFQLGMDSGPVSSTAQAEERLVSEALAPARKDFFIERHGLRFAGTHLIVDLYEAERLDDMACVEAALRDCVEAADATLLHIHLHHFTLNGGISGVAVLAESHISVHTWPECGYAAFDVFMCGDADPHRTIEVLRRAFRPARVAVCEHLRGYAE